MLTVETEKDIEFFNELVKETCSCLNINGKGYLELIFVCPDEMKELNTSSRGKNEVTDVLSFPSLSCLKPLTKENYPFEYDEELGSVNIGSIVICEEKAIEQAKEYGHSIERERSYLFVHGLLHLLGHTHDDEESKKAMREKEEKILKHHQSPTANHQLPTTRKSGFVAIIGKPNVGKSSLMNALIGDKVSITSPRPQTTRDKILGILTNDEYQMIFIDTPGILKAKNRLGQHMEKEIKEGTSAVDVVVIVLDGQKNVSKEEFELIEKFTKKGVPVYIALNKVDLAGFSKVYPTLERLAPLTSESGDTDKINLSSITNRQSPTANHRKIVQEIIPVSALKGTNIDKLRSFIASHLKDEALYYDEEQLSDKPLNFMVGEIVREKALLFLQEEIPHGIATDVISFEREGNLTRIEIDIVIERESHKKIVIGKKGEKLKEIGTSARKSIEKLLQTKVYLKLFVKVRENWRDKKMQLDSMGYK
ncbi:MAG: GTPase Era [Firmicutes bacterium]|nr:GTPase Era [Bacillota bacterium]